MNIEELVLKNRSYRRFYQDVEISKENLRSLINLARLSASGKNAQPLKYILSNASEINKKIFPSLVWAGFLKNWPGPKTGERPAAYITVLADKNISENYYCDHGIATQSILLGAVEKGFGGCIIAAVKKDELKTTLQIPNNFEILHVIALGKPKEEVVIEEITDNDFKYWRDETHVHHVPKRSIDELIITP
ncbi:MAG: nitroreductase family protein [Candidatus Heimdallarchaeota archaeon]